MFKLLCQQEAEESEESGGKRQRQRNVQIINDGKQHARTWETRTATDRKVLAW